MLKYLLQWLKKGDPIAGLEQAEVITLWSAIMLLVFYVIFI